jgi:CRISPR-associated protein Cmr3
MRYQIESDDLLILRDGRPFGDVGTFGGHSVLWPYPQTLAGMVRTSMGHAKSDDYFAASHPQRDDNLQQILKIGMQQILPMQRKATHKGNWLALFPVPGDIILTQKENNPKLTINQMSFSVLDKHQGTDINNSDWLYAQIDTHGKPAREQPFFCHWDFYQQYLKNGYFNVMEKSFDEIGVSAPINDTRVHNALSSETLITEEGKLFCNNGFYLKNQEGDLAIHFSLTGTDDTLPSQAYLGGERKQVMLNPSDTSFPRCPDWFANKSWLKLLLTTQGDFGAWCPDWLMPDLDAKDIAWVSIPNTDFNVRLRSACIKGWDAISGWDVAKHEPKAFRKLVKTGSIYLLEIQKPEQSADIACYFWGGVLESNNMQSLNDGYNQCIVANALVR